MQSISAILLQQQPGPGGAESIVMNILPFVAIIFIFYFLILRPQQKKQKERAALIAGVKKGDKIITAGGIHGTVEGVEDNSVLVKIADNVKVKIEKSSIGTIMGLTDTTPSR
jgi:preprotein translocase subunit YajC